MLVAVGKPGVAQLGQAPPRRAAGLPRSGPGLVQHLVQLIEVGAQIGAGPEAARAGLSVDGQHVASVQRGPGRQEAVERPADGVRALRQGLVAEESGIEVAQARVGVRLPPVAAAGLPQALPQVQVLRGGKGKPLRRDVGVQQPRGGVVAYAQP